LKLVAHPSAQLLLVLSSSASLAITEPRGYDGARLAVRAVVREARAVRRTAPALGARSDLCNGLALCSGAPTATPGSVEFGAVCDIAAPVRLNSNVIDRRATAEGATRLGDILITRSPKSGQKCRPAAVCRHRFQQEEEKYHWKCPMYLANFRLCPF
jgi:hypothetical protein